MRLQLVEGHQIKPDAFVTAWRTLGNTTAWLPLQIFAYGRDRKRGGGVASDKQLGRRPIVGSLATAPISEIVNEVTKMPLIDIHVLEGVFSAEEKAQIISGTAKAFGAVAGSTMEQMTSVRIHEVKSGDWGGSQSIWTTERALEAKAKG